MCHFDKNKKCVCVCCPMNNLRISDSAVWKLKTKAGEEVKQYVSPAGSGLVHILSVKRKRTPMNAPPSAETGVRCHKYMLYHFRLSKAA